MVRSKHGRAHRRSFDALKTCLGTDRMLFCLARKALSTNMASIGTNPGVVTINWGLLGLGVPAQSNAGCRVLDVNAGSSPQSPTRRGHDAKLQQGLRRPAWWRSVGALHPGSFARR